MANKSQLLKNIYGAIDGEGNFQVLSEEQMAAESLRVLEEYKRMRFDRAV
ncbi:MAG: hypothetical protein HC860_00760 [Alkalinema sp. RU_4_3]|nr:hypothetical protein [Alkalinema sp. RU_4_3]